MSFYSGIKRGFCYGEGSDSWCTKCSGLRCKEKVGYIFDQKGNVQGYIIDYMRLKEIISKKYPEYNRRLKDFPPSDGIYKRPLDFIQLISKNPAKVNTVRFSKDLLRLLLVGVEGCDDFTRGRRVVSHENNIKRKGVIDLNIKSSEVLSGKRDVKDIKHVKGPEVLNYKVPSANPLTRGN